MKWQLNTFGQFYDCDEDMVVYFDPASGDTHLISDFSAYLLQLINQSNHSLNNEEIIDLLTVDFEPADLPELAQAIPDIMSEMAALDIISHT